MQTNVTVALPRSVPSGLFPVVETRYSGYDPHVLDGWLCYHTYTGASASMSHKPDLENKKKNIYEHTNTEKEVQNECASLTSRTEQQSQ